MEHGGHDKISCRLMSDCNPVTNQCAKDVEIACAFVRHSANNPRGHKNKKPEMPQLDTVESHVEDGGVEWVSAATGLHRVRRRTVFVRRRTMLDDPMPLAYDLVGSLVGWFLKTFLWVTTVVACIVACIACRFAEDGHNSYIIRRKHLELRKDVAKLEAASLAKLASVEDKHRKLQGELAKLQRQLRDKEGETATGE